MGSVKSLFFKELEDYNRSDLSKKFYCENNNNNKFSSILKKLVNDGFLKKKSNDNKKEVNEYYYATLDNNYYSENVDEKYCFHFVGVIVIGDYVLNCYPKYYKNNDFKSDKEKFKIEFKQVLKVLQRYFINNKRQSSVEESILHMFSNIDESCSVNAFSVFLFLVHDYYENGVYSSSEDIIETNGLGEIHWDKTINSSFPIILRKRPYYFELKTRKRITNDSDFFTRLHECVLTKISEELKYFDLIDLFDLTEIELSDAELSDFGEVAYILYRIEKELAVQFNTRKQMLLKALYVYISKFKKKNLSDIECISVFGTCSFHTVWEDVCKIIFNNQLETKISDLPVNLEKTSSDYITTNQNEKLIDLIEKPYWDIAKACASETLKPDLVTINDDTFIIFDAKYYNPDISSGLSISGQPGISDITKQYLYQLAYKDFITACGFNSIYNCFLMPTCEDKVPDGTYVHLNMLKDCGLENILYQIHTS